MNNNSNFPIHMRDAAGQVETKSTNDPMLTRRQVLNLFGFRPDEDYALFCLVKNNGIKSVDSSETIDVSTSETEFFAFKTDRTWDWFIDGRRFPWGQRTISEEMVRLIAEIPDSKDLFLEKTDTPDEKLQPGAEISLNPDGVEKLYSREKDEKHWNLKVNQVELQFDTPNVSVKDALEKAGINVNQEWLIFLQFTNGSKQELGISDSIDLKDEKIKLLRTTQKDIDNGEGPSGLHREFRLLETDEKFLDQSEFEWETIIDRDENFNILGRFLKISSYNLPLGYDANSVEILVIIPENYPRTGLDSFYCFPPISKLNGGEIPNLGTNTFLKKDFQFWSRHLGNRNQWDSTRDSVITHLALIEESFSREVENV